MSAASVGGAEQILAAVDTAIVAAGHRSIVIAGHGSRVQGELIELPSMGESLTRDAWIAAHAACRAAIDDVLARESIDVVHMHGVDFHAYLPPPGPPVLVTLHLPLAWYPAHAFFPERPRTFLQCVSRTQRATAPPAARLLPEIENGVDLDLLKPAGPPAEYALTLGRICPEKGQHLALDAATRAGVPLVIAGKVFGFPEHLAYFQSEIEPRLVPPHRFVGAVAGPAKVRLIARARCLVVPSLVDETSSLGAMEALACGTPVIAFRRGALIELVEPGVTGALVDNVDELARALGETSGLSRTRCRAAAEARCDGRRMSASYLARYEELVREPRSRPSRLLRVDVVDGDGLETVEDAWCALWERDPNATVFQRPEWCLAWCRHLLRGTVEVLAVWRGSELDALLPLARRTEASGDILEPIGAGVADYVDLLMVPGASDAQRALEHALATRSWSQLELDALRPCSPLSQLAVSGTDERGDAGACPALSVPGDDALGAVPPRMRRDIEYQRRRAAREVGLDIAQLAPSELVDALAILHRARWTARGEAGVLDGARQRFLRDVAERLARRDALLSAGVRLGGALAAVALGFVDRGAARYYLGGFDPVHDRRSPGTLAVAALIEETGRRGLPWFDFLRGRESYKYRFGATDHVALAWRVVRRP